MAEENAHTLAVGGPVSKDSDSDFEPSFGNIIFNTGIDWFVDTTPATADDIPTDQYDLISVAAHEIGHVLGIGCSDAYDYYVSGNYFTGSNATQANGGAYVPLRTGDSAHVAIVSDLMYPFAADGVRTVPSSVDLGILADIGYKF